MGPTWGSHHLGFCLYTNPKGSCMARRPSMTSSCLLPKWPSLVENYVNMQFAVCCCGGKAGISSGPPQPPAVHTTSGADRRASARPAARASPRGVCHLMANFLSGRMASGSARCSAAYLHPLEMVQTRCSIRCFGWQMWNFARLKCHRPCTAQHSGLTGTCNRELRSAVSCADPSSSSTEQWASVSRFRIPPTFAHKVCSIPQYTEHDCKQARGHSSASTALCEAQCGREGQQGGRKARRRQPPRRHGRGQDRVRRRHHRLQHLRRRRAPQGTRAQSAVLCGSN